MEVGQVLKIVMAVKEWRQTKLARAIGVSQGQISKWIKGDHTPNKKQWDAILDLLEDDTRLCYLLDMLRAPVIPELDPDFYAAMRRLSPQQRKRIVNLVKGMAEDEVA